MAKNKLVLSGEDQTITLPFDANIIGTNANEVIKVVAGVDADFSVGSGDRVEVAGNLADYTVTASGNTLTLTDADGNEIILAVGDTGTLAFADGSAELDFDLANLEVTIGGVAVDDSFDAASVTLDAADPSTVGDSSTEAPTGETFTLAASSKADVFTGTAGSDTFDASALDSLQAGDLLIDGTTTDEDVLNADLAAATTATNPTVTNVETINLNAKYGSASLSLANVSGTDTLNLSSSIVAGTATLTAADTTSVDKIAAGTNISTLSVTADTGGTVGTLAVDAGSASSVTVNGGAGADNFAVTLNQAGANLNLDGGAGTDSYTVALAGGTTTITGNTNNESVTLNSATAANTVDLASNALVGTGKTINVTGDQTLTLKSADASKFNTTVVTDGLTSGDLKLLISGVAANTDLSKVAVDEFEFTGTTNTSTVTFANNANVKLSTSTQLDVVASASTDALNLTLNTATADVDAVVGATDFATINATTAKNITDLTVLMGNDASSGGTLKLAGTHDVMLNANSEAKAVDASALTGKFATELDGSADINSIITGAGADTITISGLVDADTTLSLGAGDDKVIVSVDLGNNTDRKLTFDGGEGTDTLQLNGNDVDLSSDATNEGQSVITGFEVIDLNGNDLTVTQKQGFTLGDTFTVKGTATTDIFAVAVEDAAGSAVVDLSGVTVSGLATLKIDASGSTASTTTLTGSSTVATVIEGNEGIDTITGGNGNDKIFGDKGADILTGGAGSDSFLITDANIGIANVDHITDFVAGGSGDKFVFQLGNGDFTTDANADGANGVFANDLVETNTNFNVADPIAAVSSVTVNSIEDVYTQLASILQAGDLAASSNTDINARVVEFNNGSSAGKYLVINDDVAAFQATTDIVINITGVTGNVSAADFTITSPVA